jgi:hypothetical protein
MPFSSKVNLPHAINSGAFGSAHLVTQHSKFQANETRLHHHLIMARIEYGIPQGAAVWNTVG